MIALVNLNAIPESGDFDVHGHPIESVGNVLAASPPPEGRPALESLLFREGTNGAGGSACATVAPPLLAVLQDNIDLPASKM